MSVFPPDQVGNLIPSPFRGHRSLRERRSMPFLEPILASPQRGADADRRKRLAIGRRRGWVRGRCGADALVPCASAVYAHREVVIGVAVLERACVVVGRDIPVAPHDIVDVVAVHCSVRTNARTEAELIVGYEARPFVVLCASAERVAINQTANWVSLPIMTTIIKLPSIVTLLDVDLGKVTDTGDLNVIGCPDEVDAFQRTVWDCTTTAA